MSTHKHSEVLVDTQWVAEHLDDPNVRLLEAGWDASEYESGHIPGAVSLGLGFLDFRRLNNLDVPNKTQL